MNPAPNFDALARPYRWLEYLTFGPYLQRTRTHFLPQLAYCRYALVLGDGDGRFTAQLLRRNPHIQIHAVDASPEMLASLNRSAGSEVSRVSTEVADLRHWVPDPEARYDLIVTHFFLDCLTTLEVTTLAQRLAPVTTPDALWLISDFAVPLTRFGKWIARPLILILYLSFRLLTNLRVHQLPDHSKALTHFEWILARHSERLHGLLMSQIWSRSAKPD